MTCSRCGTTFATIQKFDKHLPACAKTPKKAA
jgi:hypothetical protein